MPASDRTSTHVVALPYGPILLIPVHYLGIISPPSHQKRWIRLPTQHTHTHTHTTRPSCLSTNTSTPCWNTFARMLHRLCVHHDDHGTGTKSTYQPITAKRLPIAFVGMLMAAVSGQSVCAATIPPTPVSDLFQGTCSR